MFRGYVTFRESTHCFFGNHIFLVPLWFCQLKTWLDGTWTNWVWFSIVKMVHLNLNHQPCKFTGVVQALYLGGSQWFPWEVLIMPYIDISVRIHGISSHWWVLRSQTPAKNTSKPLGPLRISGFVSVGWWFAKWLPNDLFACRPVSLHT